METDWYYTLLNEGNVEAFRPYLTEEAASLQQDILALGAVTGEYACGAVAARVHGNGQAELLAMAVDPAVRRRGVGSMLLRNLLKRLRQTERLVAAYRGTPEELSAADAFYNAVWGGVPEDLGAVFQLRVGELADTPLYERFGYAGSERAILRFDTLQPDQMERLLREEEIPEHLRWNALPGHFRPDLSFAFMNQGRAEAYLAVTEEERGVLAPVLVALGNRSFVLLPLLSAAVRAVTAACPPETGLEIVCVNPVAEGLGLRLLGRRYLVAREHRSVCLVKTEGSERFG
jgi:GNAT superfamily N-acetyltransferase